MKRVLTRLAVLLLVPPVSAESAGANKARLETIASLEAVVPAAVGPAVEDMARTWPERCDAAKHRCLLDALQQRAWQPSARASLTPWAAPGAGA